MKIQLNAGTRLAQTELTASWGSNRLSLAIKGDEDAVKDVPKIVEDATRNVTTLLGSYPSKVKSLQRLGDSAQLKTVLKELQKLVKAIED